jgi:hypothetical protein
MDHISFHYPVSAGLAAVERNFVGDLHFIEFMWGKQARTIKKSGPGLSRLAWYMGSYAR